MPPMKNQPLVSQAYNESLIRNTDAAKPVLKSRLKRLFDRQFPSVLRNNSSAAAEFKPSSVCLAKMVQNFIEESQDSKSAAKCGRNRCNCFNGNINDSSDDEFDVSSGFNESSTSPSAVDSLEMLKSLIPCASVDERNLLAQTSKIVEKNKIFKKKDDLRKIVTDSLLLLGYDASICKSCWEKSPGPSFPAGEYEYIDVISEGERVIIDVDFRSEFEIARPTGGYKLILQSLPLIFVGRSDRLQLIVSIASEAANQSLNKKGMHVPPWRKVQYMRAKWLSSHTRTNSFHSAFKFGDGLLSSCGDERIIKSTTNHGDQHDAALLPLVNMDTYVHMSSTQPVALPDGGEIVQLESSEKKPRVDFDATNSRAPQSGVLVSNSENQNMREASKRWCMTESVLSIADSKTRISLKDYDPPDNRSHLLRAHQSGPIVFNSEKKDWREELQRECFTKSVLSLDDSTKQKVLLDFDVTENKAHLFRAYQSGPVVSLSENKSRGEALKRECITKNILGIEYLQQHCGDRCDDAAKTFGGFHKPDSLAWKSFEELETLPTEEQPIDYVPLLAQGKLTLEGCVQQEISQELPRVMQINGVEQRVTKMPRYLGGLTAQSASSSRCPICLPDGGHIMLLDPLDQSTENIEHVARVDQCYPTVFLAEKKMLRKTLKRECRTISVIFEENHQHFGRRCAGAAKSLGEMGNKEGVLFGRRKTI